MVEESSNIDRLGQVPPQHRNCTCFEYPLPSKSGWVAMRTTAGNYVTLSMLPMIDRSGTDAGAETTPTTTLVLVRRLKCGQ